MAEKSLPRLGRRGKELMAEILVRDTQQRLGPLPQRLAPEVHGAVLRDHPVHVPRMVTTPPPGVIDATTRDMRPSDAVDGSAMIGTPFGDSAAPRMKSIWPPIPE
jgi:hypothetical protein